MSVVDKPNTPAQALSLIQSILDKMANLGKPQFKFMSWIYVVWLGLPTRHTFSNLERFGPYCDKTIRLQFERDFSFVDFNQSLIESQCGPERVAAFDPSFVPKAGKSTFGVDHWWCGSMQQAMRGLEVSVTAVIDVAARTAFCLEATQTPTMAQLKAQDKTLLEHYIGLLQDQKQRFKQLGTDYLTMDAYFSKKAVVDAVLEMELHLITRLRQDADFRYLYKGERNKIGRPKKYDGKVDWSCIDKRRLRWFQGNGTADYYSGILHAVGLKREVRVVVIESKNRKHRCLLMSTDTELAPEKLVEYYKLRFQIEFLIRDSKSYAGLEECQARDQAKLDFHFNLSLSSVGIAKAAYWLSLPEGQRGAFSMRNVKMLFTCGLFTDRVFTNLGLDPTLNKHQAAYNQCLDIERIAA